MYFRDIIILQHKNFYHRIHRTQHLPFVSLGISAASALTSTSRIAAKLIQMLSEILATSTQHSASIPPARIL